MDWHSRRVLSWRLSNSMEVAFCLEALEEALARHGRPDIFNTDQGSQFTSLAFTQMLTESGIRISHQIQKTPTHRNIGDVGAPDLVGSDNGQIPQQVGANPMLRMRRARVGLLIYRPKAHLRHRRATRPRPTW